MSDGAGELKDTVRAPRAEFDRELKAVRDSSALQTLRDRYVGSKAGAATTVMKVLGAPTATRRQAGRPEPPEGRGRAGAGGGEGSPNRT